jgi:hypothetical protein
VLPPDYTFTAADFGNHVFTATFGTAGSQTIRVTDVTDASATGGSPALAVAAGSAVALKVSGYPSPDVLSTPQRFTVTAVDAFGNRVNGYRGTVHFSSSDTSALLPADYAFTAADSGAHTFTATLKTLGSQTLMATDTGTSTVSGTEAGIAVVSPATHLAITGLPSTITAGQAFNITVTALDAANHPDALFTDTVHFQSVDPGAVLPADYTFQPSDRGSRMFSITLTRTETLPLVVTDLERPAIVGLRGGITVAPAAAAALVVSGFPFVDTSGVAHPFTVTAVDAFGNQAGSYRGTVHFGVSGGGAATLPAAYTFTAADRGAHTFVATLRLPGGIQSLTATDVAGGLSGVEPAIAVHSSATHLVLTFVKTSTQAGQQVGLRVTARDALGNPDPLFQDTLHFSSSDPQAVLPDDQAFAGLNGTETFPITLGTAGSQSITVADASQPAILRGSAQVAVSAGAVRALSLSGTPLPAVVGDVARVTVTAVDAFGNPVQGYRGRVHLASSDAQAVLPADYSFTALDQGSHTFTFTLRTAGLQTLTVNDTVNGTLSRGQANLLVANLSAGVAGPAFALTGQPNGVPGQPLPFTLTAHEDGLLPAALFTYRIDWTGTGRAIQVVSGTTGLTVSHRYPAAGNFTVKVTVVDGAGNASPQTATLPVSIQPVALEADPADGSKTALAVGGSVGNDHVTISPADATGQTVSVSINGLVQPGGPFAPTGHILVFGQGSNEVLQVLAATINHQVVKVAVPALLFGGTGPNTLSVAGSSANNILVGGPGSDRLSGGSGRDILIGGAGADVLQAGSGGDILIGSTTAYDANPAASLALMAEWGRTDLGYQARVQHLFGDAGGGLNGTYFLNTQTVARDLAINQLFGGIGSDWFWLTETAHSADHLSAFLNGEVASFE